jgi:predicted DNA-binding transcriptional regulator AlpA
MTMPKDSSKRRRSAPALLVDAGRAAESLGVSRSVFYSLDSQGAVPQALALGLGARRRRLWSVPELRAWVSAGAPARHEWEHMKARANL